METGVGPRDRGFRQLQKTLASVVGLALGGLGTAALAMLWGLTGWVLVIPPLLGLVVGLVLGDRGVQLLARLLRWL